MNELTTTDNRELIQADWYQSLIDDCGAIIVEAEFTSRWVLVEGYHLLGQRILAENDNFERKKIYGQKIVQRVAESLNKKERTIFNAVKFAKKFPDLASLYGSKTAIQGECDVALPIGSISAEPNTRFLRAVKNKLPLAKAEFRSAGCAIGIDKERAQLISHVGGPYV